MRRLRFDIDDPKMARLAWSRLVEPGDPIAGAILANLGASDALRWLLSRCAGTNEHNQTDATNTGLLPADSAVQAPRAAVWLRRAVDGWVTRIDDLDPVSDLRAMRRLGVHPLLPTDANWPPALNELELSTPLMLWVRGDAAALAAPSVAMVGSRASTNYGEMVASDFAGGLVERGWLVISGGAYGIDAAAHRGALSVDQGAASTIAVMASGLERFYPAGNEKLLKAVTEHGAVIAEVPPGAVPYRHRFLARNRLVAALSRATVVVEAAWRSGALSTARHAAELLRPVGAVPGPITSMASGGCHQLIRDGLATCVTDVAEVVELAGPIVAGRDRQGELDSIDPLAELDHSARRVYNVLPLHATATVKWLSNSVGLPEREVLGALGSLTANGLARQSDGGRWGKLPPY